MNTPNPSPFASHYGPTSTGPAGATLDPLVDAHAQPWERTYAMATHLTLLAIHVAIPVVPALVMYLIKKDESPFIRDHGREAVNFQITLIVYSIVGAIMVAACGVGLIMLAAVYVLAIVGMVMAAVAAHSGRFYRYPACIRFLTR